MQALILNCDVALSEGPRKKGSVVCYLEDGVTPSEARAALENLQLCDLVPVTPPASPSASGNGGGEKPLDSYRKEDLVELAKVKGLLVTGKETKAELLALLQPQSPA